jgi:phosphoribosylanthranilate isomerase
MRPWLKVCCISSVEEARVAIECGAQALGLVGAMPTGPGVIDDVTIAAIARSVPPPVSRFLLTSFVTGAEIATHARTAGVDTVQIVDAVPLSAYDVIRREVPSLRIVQVLHVEDRVVLDEAARIAPHVHALLLDSGRPSQRELGGTGRVHDWELSRRVVEIAGKPVFLAGGLNPGNVAEAVARVKPAGLDICSGVRTDGALDVEKLRALVAAF